MLSYAAKTNIRATSDAVWKILTDAADYPNWNPEITRIDGRIAKGEKLTVHIKIAPGSVGVTVSEFEPAGPVRRMVWTGGLPGGMFKGERSFIVTPRASAAGGEEVEVEMQLKFSGPMAPMITKSIPDQQPVFDAVAAALKKRAEQG